MSLTAQRTQLVDYSDILRGSAALAGFGFADIGTTEFDLFRTFHDRRLQAAWEIHPWPDVCRIEQRSFRPPYSAIHIYNTGDEVLDVATLQYYQALTGPISGRPPTIDGVENSAYWALCRPVYTGPDYDAALSYADGSIVRNPTDNQFYQACVLIVDLTLTGTDYDGVYAAQYQMLPGGGSYVDYHNGKPFYVSDANVVQWDDVSGTGTDYRWCFYNKGNLLYTSVSNTATPANAAGWTNYSNGESIAFPFTFDRPLPGSGWAPLNPFRRTIAWQQTTPNASSGYVNDLLTPIGEAVAAYDRDPQLTTKVVKLPFVVTNEGIAFRQLRQSPAYVWLQFRLPRPLLDGEAFDASLVYTAGQSVYYTSATTGKGNFYVAQEATTAGDTPESAPAKWSRVEIPYLFRGYLIQGGYLDWLTGNGQNEKAVALEHTATALLELEADKLQRQQQQVQRFDWRR
jgi:hypothetical protein